MKENIWNLKELLEFTDKRNSIIYYENGKCMQELPLHDLNKICNTNIDQKILITRNKST